MWRCGATLPPTHAVRGRANGQDGFPSGGLPGRWPRPPIVRGPGAVHKREGRSVWLARRPDPLRPRWMRSSTSYGPYRDTLPEDEQRLLNSMFFAAIGKQEAKDDDTPAYRYAYPYAGWYGSPW